MKFLVDAQLPRRLAREIAALGGDALHTLDLPALNRTGDREIIAIVKQQARILITKDSDFVDSYLLTREPPQLVHVTTGNIPNKDLLRIFRAVWPGLLSMLAQGHYIELSRTSLTLHD